MSEIIIVVLWFLGGVTASMAVHESMNEAAKRPLGTLLLFILWPFAAVIGIALGIYKRARAA